MTLSLQVQVPLTMVLNSISQTMAQNFLLQDLEEKPSQKFLLQEEKPPNQILVLLIMRLIMVKDQTMDQTMVKDQTTDQTMVTPLVKEDPTMEDPTMVKDQTKELMLKEPSLVTNIQVETTVKEVTPDQTTEKVTEKSQENRS